MDENLILARNMISANRHAVIKSSQLNQRLMIETLEADDEGNIWCWVDEDEVQALHKFNNVNVSLKYADKVNGRFMIANGVISIMNFISPSVAGCFRKTTGGYLCKVDVLDYEYFEKRQIAPHTNMLDSIRKYSLELAQSINHVTVRTKNLIYGSAVAKDQAAA
jgi:hypothetical protein